MLGACGQLPDLGSPEMMAVSQPSEKPEVQEGPANDPEKATDYWGKKFAKNPRDLKSALNYARNLKAMGQKRRAISVLSAGGKRRGHTYTSPSQGRSHDR